MMLGSNTNYPGTMRRCEARVGGRTSEAQCVRTRAQDVGNAVAARGTGRLESVSFKMYRSCTVVPEFGTGKQKMYQSGTCVLI